MLTVTCVNQMCQKKFEVNAGVQAAYCPHCDTFRFIQDDSGFNSGFDSGSSPGEFMSPVENHFNIYGPPEIPLNPPKVDNQFFDDPYKINNEEPVVPKETGPPGYLVSEQGKKYPLKVGKNIVGRSGCDIVIDDKTVSRKHCVIEVVPTSNSEGWDFIIYDIGHLEGGTGSANGTILSNRTIRIQNYERIPIYSGIGIQLGTSRLQLLT